MRKITQARLAKASGDLKAGSKIFLLTLGPGKHDVVIAGRVGGTGPFVRQTVLSNKIKKQSLLKVSDKVYADIQAAKTRGDVKL